MPVGLNQLNNKVEALLRKSCVQSVETLKQGEVFRLDHRSRMLRVQSGQVWISWDGDDYVLESGQEMMFPTGTEDAVISVPINVAEASFELLCIPAGSQT
jgi:hypothetical protein